MTRNAAKLALTALWGLSALAGVGVAHADPFNPSCFVTPEQSCQSGNRTGQIRYCPGGGFVGEFTGSCPSLWTGPYAPGNPSYGGDDDR